MLAPEFTAARERLGLTAEQVAAEVHLTRGVVEAWERGTLKIPADVARTLRWRVAVEERARVLAASGLAACATADVLEEAAAERDGERLLATLNELTAHAEACEVCRARREYLERHAPALPELPTPRWIRLFDAYQRLINRLPPPLRPPEGPSGQGRRAGIFAATALAVYVIAVAVLFSASALTRSGWTVGWWREPLRTVAVMIPGYFIGFYLAGAAFDLLRPIGHRFIGYVLRWGIGGAIVYGTIAALMPLLDDDPMSAGDSLIFALLLGGVCGVIGAGLWVKDRLKGKLQSKRGA